MLCMQECSRHGIGLRGSLEVLKSNVFVAQKHNTAIVSHDAVITIVCGIVNLHMRSHLSMKSYMLC